MVVIFNTMTNSSKQSRIATAKDLPEFADAAQGLTKALRIPTIAPLLNDDSTSTTAFYQFHQWLQQQYPAIFNNPNVEWQRFDNFSLVGKWIGRSSELPPIVLVAEQFSSEPSLEHIPEWTFNPFMGKIDQGYIYGRGTQNGKAAMLALLESFNTLVKKDILPSRTIYFAFPHNAQQAELAIISALKQAQIQPEFILRTGGLIAQNMFWEIQQPTALIGIGKPSIMQAQIAAQHADAFNIVKKESNQLAQDLPILDVEHPVLEQFIAYLSPELDFGNRTIFSNAWLLSTIQEKKLQQNKLVQQLFGNSLQIECAADTAANTSTALLTFFGQKPYKDLDQWIKNRLQHPQVHLLGESRVLYHNSKLAAIDNRAYRVIGNTAKEIFPNLLTMPVLVNNTSTTNWEAHLNTDIYYFHPVIYTAETWEKAQRGIDDKISIKNYTQMIQYYHQLLLNTIE